MATSNKFSLPQGYNALHEYGRVVVDGALKRGLMVEVADPPRGELLLTLGNRSVRTRESLSELTTAVALDRCQDKWAARRRLSAAGSKLPRARVATMDTRDYTFLAEVGAVVAKPARGAEGRSVVPGIRTAGQLAAAIKSIGAAGSTVILEEMCIGVEVRVLTIAFGVLAAVVRTPPTVIADGVRTVHELITAKNQGLRTTLGPHAGIAVDDVTHRTLESSGFSLADVPHKGEIVQVRHPTSLSADRLAGGTLRDVTEVLHPEIRKAAEEASRALEMSVLGLDMIISSPCEPQHCIIDANERPGLSNYAPQPVVDRFLELLFPELRTRE